MKKVLVLSDSHKHTQIIADILNKEKPDYLIFCGDLLSDLEKLNIKIPIYSVKGNWDYNKFEKLDNVVNIENITVFITHGHKYKVKCGLNNLILSTKNNNYKIVCYGHTHKQNLININNVYFLNAGSCANGEYAIIDLDNNNLNLQLKNINKEIL